MALQQALRVAREVAALSRRNLVRFVRFPNLLAIVIVQPLLLVFLFRYVFGGAIETPSVPYVQFLMPGIFAMIIVQGSGNAGVGFADDIATGVIDRFRALPVSRVSLLAARTVADAVKNVLLLALMAAVGIAVGFRFSTSAGNVVAALALALAFGLAMAWVSLTITLWLRNPEAVQGGLFLLTLVLTFVSSSFVPPETMPSWLRTPVENSPVSQLVEALRHLTIGVGSAGAVPTTLAWIAGLLFVTVPWTVSQYRGLT